MERKIKFVKEEHYHLYSRGVEKRKIFLDIADYERFMALLYILNQKKHFHVSNFLSNKKHSARDLYQADRADPLISILSFSLMPNHFHLVVRETNDGGISNFMMKLLTAYSMYFNKKNERSGPLFVKPFRSEHLHDDQYFRHIFNYVHLNCLDLFESNWKHQKSTNTLDADLFLQKYRYSSYPDFIQSLERPESKIIDSQAIPDFVSRGALDIEDYGTSDVV